MKQQPPNQVSLPSGLGRNRDSSGNRIDRLTERAWMNSQELALPYGPVAGALSLLKTALIRDAVFLCPVALAGIYGYTYPLLSITGLLGYSAHSAWIIWDTWSRREDMQIDLVLRGLMMALAVAYGVYAVAGGGAW